MKTITIKGNMNSVPFRWLENGDMFIDEDELFVKVEDKEDNHFNCKSMFDGGWYHIEPRTVVSKVRVMTIEEGRTGA